MAVPAQDVFSVTTSMLAPCRVLSLSGELDELAAPVLDEALGDEEREPLIVDLSGLDFICSAGIHVLLRARRVRSAIVCPPGNIARVLGLVRAEKVAPLFDNVDAAHDALCASTV
jgi:anti-anti-sigma factor